MHGFDSRSCLKQNVSKLLGQNFYARVRFPSAPQASLLLLGFCEAKLLGSGYNAGMEQRAGLPENIIYPEFIFRSHFRVVLMLVLMGELLREGIPAAVSAGTLLNNKIAKASNEFFEM